jgi:hypothetical protein
MLQHAQAFVLIYSKHHDGGLAMFGHGLWCAPRRLDNLTESILGILHRPIAPRHRLSF